MTLGRSFGSGSFVWAWTRHHSRWRLIRFRLPIWRCIVVIVKLILSTLWPITGCALARSWVKVYTRLSRSSSWARISILTVLTSWSCQGTLVGTRCSGSTISAIWWNIGACSSCLRTWTLIQGSKDALIRPRHSFTFANDIKSLDLLCQIIFYLIDFKPHLLLVLSQCYQFVFVPF